MIPKAPQFLYDSCCNQAVTIRLEVGAVYRFVGIGKGPGEPLPPTMPETGGRSGLWRVQPGAYRFVGLSRSVRMLGREEAVFEGLQGSEKEKLYHCTLEDVSRHFLPLDAKGKPVGWSESGEKVIGSDGEESGPVPEKVAGYVPEGWRSGV